MAVAALEVPALRTIVGSVAERLIEPHALMLDAIDDDLASGSKFREGYREISLHLLAFGMSRGPLLPEGHYVNRERIPGQQALHDEHFEQFLVGACCLNRCFHHVR
jgi:hypothetical protein